MKILIINPGGLPVPDVKGGAVQAIVTDIIKQNEIKKNIDLYSMTPYDYEAACDAEKYKSTHFIFFSVPKIIKFVDKLIYYLFSHISSHPDSYSRIIKSFYYVFYLSKHLMKNNYDYIIFEHNHLLLLSLCNPFVYQDYKDKYCIHIHNKVRAISLSKIFIHKCKHIITISNYMKEYLIHDKTLHVDSNSVYVIHNCIDRREFYKKIDTDIDLSKLSIDKSRKIILFAGRINREKGIDKLIDAYNELDKDQYQLVIVGNAFYSDKRKSKFGYYLMKKCERDVEQNNIVFTGYVNRNNLVDYYNVADVIVMPSMWDEPAGLAMVEAAFCNKPLITTNSGGIPEYVGDYALIINRDNVVDEIVNGIKHIISSDMFFDSTPLIERFDVSSYYNEFEILFDLAKDNK